MELSREEFFKRLAEKRAEQDGAKMEAGQLMTEGGFTAIPLPANPLNIFIQPANQHRTYNSHSFFTLMITNADFSDYASPEDFPKPSQVVRTFTSSLGELHNFTNLLTQCLEETPYFLCLFGDAKITDLSVFKAVAKVFEDQPS